MRRWMPLGLSLLSLAIVLPEVLGNGAAPNAYSGYLLEAAKKAFVPVPIAMPAREVRVIVRVDEKAKSPLLQVPLNLFFGEDAAPKRGADAGRSHLPTIVAGLALTFAFVSGGMWLVRRRFGRNLTMLLILSVFFAATAAVWANLPPRPTAPPPVPAPAALPALKLPAGIELTDKLLIQAVPNDDHLTLIVPKSMVVGKTESTPQEKRAH